MQEWILYLLIILSTSCIILSENISNNSKIIDLNMDVKFAYTIFYVNDVPKTLRFYENVFGFKQKMITPENDYGEVHSGETTLAFASFELGRSNLSNGFLESNISNKPFGIELAFTTSDVDGTMKHAFDHGAILLEKSVVKPWGQKVGYIKDLNGFLLEICTPIENN